MHVVLAGGGTAGHIEPAMNLADALRRRDASVGVTALGTARGLETTLVPARGYDLALIPAVPLPRRPSGGLFTVPSRMRTAVRAAADVLDRTRADVVVGFGGYVATPAYLAARRRHVPIVVHEANARPGLANRLGARFTPYVAESVPGSGLPHARTIGIPLRSAISGLDRAARRHDARVWFGLDVHQPVLLVFGGSQGARNLNDVLDTCLDALRAAGVQVLHAAGPGHDAALERAEAVRGDDGPAYIACSYLDRMDLAYAAADLALCRAGAMTCAELAAVGLPAVYVPLPIGNGEQRFNALPVVTDGGGLIVDDADLSADWVSNNVIGLIFDHDRLTHMSAAAGSHGHRNADESLANLVEEAAATGSRR